MENRKRGRGKEVRVNLNDRHLEMWNKLKDELQAYSSTTVTSNRMITYMLEQYCTKDETNNSVLNKSEIKEENSSLNPININKIMTIYELADYLSMSDATIRRQVKRNELPYFKIGNKVLFKRDYIDKWIVDQIESNNV